jgi:hypothetical protein
LIFLSLSPRIKVLAEREVLNKLLDSLGDDGFGGRSSAVVLEGLNW